MTDFHRSNLDDSSSLVDNKKPIEGPKNSTESKLKISNILNLSSMKKTNKSDFDYIFSSSDDDVSNVCEQIPILSKSKPKTSTSRLKTKDKIPLISKITKNSSRRISGWCQTSPELLILAKAEAMGRRALNVGNSKFKSSKLT